MYKNAVYLTPDGHPYKPPYLSNLGSNLTCRFMLLGDLSDLNAGISMHKDALHLAPDGHLFKPSILNNIGLSLHTRFLQLGDISDLDECILKHKDAVHLTPDGHPDKSNNLWNLGNSFLSRFEQLHGLNDLQQTISSYSAAACSTTGSPQVRLRGAISWALCTEKVQHPSLVDAYQVALSLLPEAAWLGLSISDRHYQIRQTGSLVRDAAAAAISSGQPEKAVEWLEQGRGIIWGQLLNLRTPVDSLREKFPEHANELISLSAHIEAATTQIKSSRDQPYLRFIAEQAHENAQKRLTLLQKIRQLEGFQRFLLPKSISELLPAAEKGPVVFLNVSRTSCDGLILLKSLSDQVMHVSFPEFTPEHVKNLTQSFANLMSDVGYRNISRLHAHREGRSTHPEGEFAHILSELWMRLVKPVLDALAITVSHVIEYTMFL
jgi:hypothetical protein